MKGQLPNRPGPEIHDVDFRIAVLGHAHDHLLAVRGKTRREGHARKIAQHLLAAGVDIENVDPGKVAVERQIGDLLKGR